MVSDATRETFVSPVPVSPGITSPGPMSRSQVMERIISINPTATVQFLGRFADRSLRGYLDHLSAAQSPRGRSSTPWVRPADSPAIVMRVPND